MSASFETRVCDRVPRSMSAGLVALALALLAGSCGSSAAPASGNAATTSTTMATGSTAGSTAGSMIAATARCTPARPAPDPADLGTFDWQGQARAYLVAMPPGHDGSKQHPLVLDFHGYASSKEVQEANTKLAEKGAARGYIVVTPEALGAPHEWNMFGQATRADDYGFIDALVGDLLDQLCVDATRVYAAGHSNGSAFTGFIACKAPYRFAAIAMVSATVPSTCPAEVMPAVISIHGTADPQVPYRGGTIPGLPVPSPDIEALIGAYGSRYGCGPTPMVDQPAAGVRRTSYTGCKAATEVNLVTIEDGSHSWPGGFAATSKRETERAPGETFPASDRILDFFDRHAKP